MQILFNAEDKKIQCIYIFVGFASLPTWIKSPHKSVFHEGRVQRSGKFQTCHLEFPHLSQQSSQLQVQATETKG